MRWADSWKRGFEFICIAGKPYSPISAVCFLFGQKKSYFCGFKTSTLLEEPFNSMALMAKYYKQAMSLFATWWPKNGRSLFPVFFGLKWLLSLSSPLNKDGQPVAGVPPHKYCRYPLVLLIDKGHMYEVTVIRLAFTIRVVQDLRTVFSSGRADSIYLCICRSF